MAFFRWPVALLVAGFLVAGSAAHEPPAGIQQVAPGVLRVSGWPAAYVLVEGHKAIVIGCPERVRIEDLRAYGVDTCTQVLLTHHHRDSSAGAESWIARGATVRAGRRSAEWLTPKGVKGFWDASLPAVLPGEFPPLFHRRWKVWNYWVHPQGVEGIRCDLEDDQELQFYGWTIRAVATPGHSPDHLAYLAAPFPADGRRIVFCGDAICAPGKIWSPYTTDWHHANDEGLVKAAESLRRLAALKPILLCPEHGLPIAEGVQQALEDTALNLQRAASLKSFERFRQQHGPDVPLPRFLAPEQVGSATPAGNTRPWSRLSPHLYLTGNTYALASRDGPVLLVDPYDRGLQQRQEELRRDYKVGPVEVALITHAHNDHYTGVFALSDNTPVQVWTLDRIAGAIGTPSRFRAPYVDPRPVRVHRSLQSGETVIWREYALRFEHQPGQTDLSMSIEVDVDGRRVLFTGDNFYRADQYTGSGGWSGLNRGLPGGYVSSLRRLIERNPEWVLTEHGGAMQFDRADFELRQQWAEAAARAADVLSPSGDHRIDWDPHRIRFEPVELTSAPGQTLEIEAVAKNPTDREQRLRLLCDETTLLGEPIGLIVPPRDEVRKRVVLKVPQELAPGRHVVPFHAERDGQPDPVDFFIVLNVER